MRMKRGREVVEAGPSGSDERRRMPRSRSRRDDFPGVRQAKALLKDAGLPFPPIPSELARRFVKRDTWVFASRPLKIWPYNIREYVKQTERPSVTDYVALAHAGHGINSYALHYYLVRKPLFLFLQLAWGGVYMDSRKTTVQIDRCFRLCAGVIEATEEAVLKDREFKRARFMVVGSDFYGSNVRCEHPGGERNSIEKEFERPEKALKAASTWIKRLETIPKDRQVRRRDSDDAPPPRN